MRAQSAATAFYMILCLGRLDWFFMGCSLTTVWFVVSGGSVGSHQGVVSGGVADRWRKFSNLGAELGKPVEKARRDFRARLLPFLYHFSLAGTRALFQCPNRRTASIRTSSMQLMLFGFDFEVCISGVHLCASFDLADSDEADLLQTMNSFIRLDNTYW